ncbi:MAG TPA: flagellar FlbD family protein [Candidatus Avimonas sp.]|mgnify:FL=1|jgi:flagellar protein FlbD|nr:flagellar FlbD family protein [Clostridiales bacterium]HOB37200.1 flagellar FlbD family protein [Candidatus Avimonas sp.]HQA15553.1 flagellar FlbD family protein [Candidatus Avimonas sp.]HQD37583.1 flagellar FlbD family protein [Candidatus Avimonas sp.]
MIELTDLSDRSFVLNSELIESITSIPETKISLTNGNYYLVKETPSEIIEKVVKYKKSLKYKGS